MGADPFHRDLRFARWLPRATVGRHLLTPVRLGADLAARFRATHVEVEPVGHVTVRVHRPAACRGPSPALLWIHGGGYVLGTAGMDDPICRHIADDLQIVVVAVDYRLAPEHPFPEPLHDCYDALEWIAGRSDIDPSRIAIGGASAGGGLAAALALMAHQRGQIPIALQLLAYPMLDDRTATRTDIDERHFRLWNNRSNRFGWESYLGHPAGSDRVSGLASPARQHDLSGLPPAWIGVGTLDLFYEEDVRYAERLRAAGVECTLEVVEGAYHGFDAVHPSAGVSKAFHTSQRKALSAVLEGAR